LERELVKGKGMANRECSLELGRSPRHPRQDVDFADCPSLDAFLELKLENERLREELRELQLDMDEYEELRAPLASSCRQPY
jgi:hypothetical protein